MTSDRYFFPVITICYHFLSMLIFTNNCHLCNGYFFGPEFQICDSTSLHKYRKNFCLSKLVFTSNATRINSDCICVSGIWIVINRDCIPSVLVSQEGCILSPQIKAMQYLGAFGKDDFFAVITVSDLDFTFGILRPVQNSVVNGQIWLFNGILIKSDSGTYCAEKWEVTNEATNLSGIARYTIKGKLTVQYECPPHYSEQMEANLVYDLRTHETSECIIDCTKQTASKLVFKRDMKAGLSHHPHAHHFLKRKKFKKRENVENETLPLPQSIELIELTNDTDATENPKTVNATEADEKTISPGVKSLIHNLDRRLLTRVLVYGFRKHKYGMDSRPEYIPHSSFHVLEKLKDIAFRTCAGKVSNMFLEFAYVMFRIAYENRGTDLMEYLTKQEKVDILQFLNECLVSIQPLKFNKGDAFCSDEVIKTVQYGGEYVTVNFTANYTTDFYLKERHLTMEIPWNMIDLTLAVCIGSFAESYILYHKMEQALEKLFIKDLKTLWDFPPETGTLYTRIYGPNWKYYAENLEKCVQAVYIHNPKLTRLKRPGELGLQLTEHSENDLTHRLIGHTPMVIPPITDTGEHSDEDLIVPGKTKEVSLLKSVDLTCQPLDASQCYFEYTRK